MLFFVLGKWYTKIGLSPHPLVVCFSSTPDSSLSPHPLLLFLPPHPSILVFFLLAVWILLIYLRGGFQTDRRQFSNAALLETQVSAHSGVSKLQRFSPAMNSNELPEMLECV